MTITIIQRLWKEYNKKKIKICEGACGPQLWKEGSKKKKKFCESDSDHMVLWNFRLRYQPSGLPSLNILNLG
jgi:hypothetical protein